MTKVTVVLMTDGPIRAGQAVEDLTIEQLLTTEPRAEQLLGQIRSAIGEKIKAERVALELSLEQVRDLSNREIDSAGLSRLERGQAWSADLADRALAFLRKRRKAAERKAERATARA